MRSCALVIGRGRPREAARTIDLPVARPEMRDQARECRRCMVKRFGAETGDLIGVCSEYDDGKDDHVHHEYDVAKRR